jgi:hypothetical protein
MSDLPWFFGLFKNLQGFQKNIPLTLPVSHLSYRSPVRIFNGCRSGDPNSPVKIVGGSENNGGKPSLF